VFRAPPVSLAFSSATALQADRFTLRMQPERRRFESLCPDLARSPCSGPCRRALRDMRNCG